MSDLLNVTLHDREVRRKIKRFKKELRGRIIGRAIVTSAEATIILDARRRLRQNNSIFEGNLHKSLSAKIVSAGLMSEVKIGSIGVEYGKNIEEGTPPGLPMSADEVSKLVEWVRRKLHVGASEYMSKSGKHVWRNAPSSAAIVKVVAYNIAASIKEKGTKAYPFLMPAWWAEKRKFFKTFRAKARRSLKLK